MLAYIRKIPIIQYNVEKFELGKIVFPMVIEEILEIRYIESKTDKILTWKDEEFTGAAYTNLNYEDAIYIYYLQKDNPNIEIILKIWGIHQFFCGIKTIMELRASRKRYDYGFGGARINIMDRSYYANDENPSKYFIDISEEIISIDANQVVVDDVKYYNKNKNV